MRDPRRWPDQQTADAALVLGLATWEHGAPRKRYALFSGGVDSLTSTGMMMDTFGFDAVVHIETGTGVKSTTAHVLKVCEERGWPVLHMRPWLDEVGRRGLEYRAMVAGLTEGEVAEIALMAERKLERPLTAADRRRFGIKVQEARGFPGPGAHQFSFIRLKDRPIAQLVRQSKVKRSDRIWLATGVRSQESVRRMGTVHAVQREGARVWVAPIWTWDKVQCHAYIQARGLEQCPASMFIGMSGECLCGSYAKPGELDRLATMFPEEAKELLDLELLAQERGCPRKVWGRRGGVPGIMCVGCESDPKVAA